MRMMTIEPLVMGCVTSIALLAIPWIVKFTIHYPTPPLLLLAPYYQGLYATNASAIDQPLSRFARPW